MITFALISLTAMIFALSLDWLQTLWIARNPVKASEINVILGKHPSVARVCWYFAAWIVVLAGIAVALFAFGWIWPAVALCVLAAVFEAVVVIRNFILHVPA